MGSDTVCITQGETNFQTPQPGPSQLPESYSLLTQDTNLKPKKKTTIPTKVQKFMSFLSIPPPFQKNEIFLFSDPPKKGHKVLRSTPVNAVMNVTQPTKSTQTHDIKVCSTPLLPSSFLPQQLIAPSPLLFSLLFIHKQQKKTPGAKENPSTHITNHGPTKPPSFKGRRGDEYGLFCEKKPCMREFISYFQLCEVVRVSVRGVGSGEEG